MIKLKSLLKEEKEYIIWGIPPNKREEEILFTKAKSMGEARKVIDILKTKYEVKGLRIQTLDISQDTDFSKEFGKTIKEVEDGHENDRDMVVGVADIIRMVDDMDNRKRIAKVMLKKFKEEDTIHNVKEFLTMCGIYQ